MNYDTDINEPTGQGSHRKNQGQKRMMVEKHYSRLFSPFSTTQNWY